MPNEKDENIELVIKDEQFLNMNNLLCVANQPQNNKKPENDIDNILVKIRKNCVYLSIYHNRKHHFYKNILFCVFRIPLIILSGLNSFFAVGLQNYLDQQTISLLNALISLFCGILTSVELLWQLKDRVDQELESYKNFYKLSTDVFKFLGSSEENKQNRNDFLTEIYNLYQKHIATANAINVYRRGFLDELEYLDNNDKGEVIEFIQKKRDKDLKIYYFSECCI
jgi:hypothetical protein